MGYQFFPFSQSQGLDMRSCTAACTAQTQYNSRHPKSDCTYNPCVRISPVVVTSTEQHLTPPPDICQWLRPLQERCSAGPVLFYVQPVLGPFIRQEHRPIPRQRPLHRVVLVQLLGAQSGRATGVRAHVRSMRLFGIAAHIDRFGGWAFWNGLH
jgi:hypothetical protein